METPSDRLRIARAKKFETAADAARAMHVSVNTYRQHENDTRGLGGIPRKAAEKYAARLGCSLDWLMTGKGEGPVDPYPSAETLVGMIRDVIDEEVTVGTKMADLPEIVGKALRDKLEHLSTSNVTELYIPSSERDPQRKVTKPASRDGRKDVEA